MKNIENILKEAGLMFDNVVRTKIYLTNMNDFSAVNNVYGLTLNQIHQQEQQLRLVDYH